MSVESDKGWPKPEPNPIRCNPYSICFLDQRSSYFQEYSYLPQFNLFISVFFFILKLIMNFNLDICTFNTFRHFHPVQATIKIMGTGQCTALHYVSNEHLLS